MTLDEIYDFLSQTCPPAGRWTREVDQDAEDRSVASFYPDGLIAMIVEDLSLEGGSEFSWRVFIPHVSGGQEFGPPWFKRLKVGKRLPCELNGHAVALEDAQRAAEDALLAVGVPIVGRDVPKDGVE